MYDFGMRRLTVVEHVTPVFAKFPAALASSLGIRQYSCALHRAPPKIYLNTGRRVTIPSFLHSAKCEFADMLTHFKNERKAEVKRRRL